MWQGTNSKVLLVAALMLAPLPAMAGDDHGHAKGPHGGEVKSLGKKYHLEATRTGATAKIYALGGDGKGAVTIAKHGGGTITVIAPGQAQSKTELPAGQDFSETEVKVPEKGKVTVLVTLKDGGESMSAKFAFD